MTRRVDFLAPGEEPTELRVLLRQLAQLWKFELRELPPDVTSRPSEDHNLLMVDLGSAPGDYQKVVAGHLQAGPSRTLLFATQTVALQPTLRELSGVKAVTWRNYDRDLNLRITNDDPLLNGIGGSPRLLWFNDGKAGAIETDKAAALLRADNGMNLLARQDTCYTVALPVWQFGVVSFPAWFRMMENALFFNDGLPHLAPGPYVAFRIDDLPVTGESSLKQGYSDIKACAEIREIQAGHRLYGAKMEYMLSSHAMTPEGNLIKAPELAPKAFGLLRELYQRREINIGVHSRAHLDVSEYRRTRKIVPQEFLGLDETETRATLESLRQWLAEVFGKDRLGFVAPAWGYREGVTKPEASTLFSYMADSNQHLQQSDGQDLFGTIRNGCVNLYETWRSGMSGISMANETVFQSYLGSGLPIHLMLHGPFSRDPLTRRRKIWLLWFAFLAMLGGNIGWWYGGNQRFWLAWMLLQIIAVITGYGIRRNLGWRLRLVLSRLGVGESLRQLAKAAQQAGAKFVFAEELADHMAEYEALSVQSFTQSECRVQVRLACVGRLTRAVSVHFPGSVSQAVIQPAAPSLTIADNVVNLSQLEQGTYELSAVIGNASC